MAGKPCIVTRVVDTMTDTPRPTRAEATDVANAVLDGEPRLVLMSGARYESNITSRVAKQTQPSSTLYFDLKPRLSDLASGFRLPHQTAICRDLVAVYEGSRSESGSTVVQSKRTPKVRVAVFFRMN